MVHSILEFDGLGDVLGWQRRRAGPDDPALLPETAGMAVAALRADDLLASLLGPPLLEAFCAVRLAEADRFAGVTPEEIGEATRWSQHSVQFDSYNHRAASASNGVKRWTHRKTVTWSVSTPRSTRGSSTSR
ncbi:hypothetical protein OHA72_50280 [Dactylosporangium sp. NBC_01737]|uniref:hypothetical protein n=1 Tax=Dactylosporangium sp. NBC_01737 TaxID=2975959 RepID=UPI002E156F1A|nr:hypothetical protein OHA72_50280 [Dactylosporangium sp. NBC_01737]